MGLHTDISDHSLILSLEPEDILVEFLPRLTERRVHVVQNVNKASVEVRLRVRVRVEVTDAIPLSVSIVASQGIGVSSRGGGAPRGVSRSSYLARCECNL